MASDLLYFEDFPVGEVMTYGAYEITSEEVIAFAAEFDPQPFHLDEAAAAESLFGGVVASGWHVCAIMNRMMVDAYFGRSASMGSFGLKEMRWVRPVVPGDILSVRRTTLEGRVSAKRPEMGILTFRWEALDQRGEVKAVMTGANLVRTRAAAA